MPAGGRLLGSDYGGFVDFNSGPWWAVGRCLSLILILSDPRTRTVRSCHKNKALTPPRCNFPFALSFLSLLMGFCFYHRFFVQNEVKEM
jgi:hypothetical protein